MVFDNDLNLTGSQNCQGNPGSSNKSKNFCHGVQLANRVAVRCQSEVLVDFQ